MQPGMSPSTSTQQQQQSACTSPHSQALQWSTRPKQAAQPEEGTSLTAEGSDLAAEAPDLATEAPDLTAEAPDLTAEAPALAAEASALALFPSDTPESKASAGGHAMQLSSMHSMSVMLLQAGLWITLQACDTAAV
eukprot:scaffold245783_cov19-Tisochrysis_lutea.AAC.1